MDEQTKKAIDLVVDITKQVLTLAVGIIALSVTFLKEFLQSTKYPSSFFIIMSWILLVFSIIFGILNLGNIAGLMAREEPLSPKIIFSPPVRVSAFLQIISLTMALVFLIIFGTVSLERVKKVPDSLKGSHLYQPVSVSIMMS